MDTFAERFDVSTASRTKFAPDNVTLKDNSQWCGVRLEQWECQPQELPETVLLQHGLLVNLAVKSSEIRWSGRPLISGNFEPGSLGIIPAGVPYSARSSKPSRTLVLGMRPTFLEAAVRNSRLKTIELTPAYGLNDGFILQACNALARDIHEGYPCGSMYGESIAVALAAYLVRFHSADPRMQVDSLGASERQCARIREFVLDRLHEPLSLADMASFMQLDVYSFARWFKSSFGLPPHKYVLTARIERAKTLLVASQEGIASVALQCGFSSQSHMTTVFRRFVGVSPKIYRTAR